MGKNLDNKPLVQRNSFLLSTNMGKTSFYHPQNFCEYMNTKINAYVAAHVNSLLSAQGSHDSYFLKFPDFTIGVGYTYRFEDPKRKDKPFVEMVLSGDIEDTRKAREFFKKEASKFEKRKKSKKK
jgi:hypothetical protein